MHICIYDAYAYMMANQFIVLLSYMQKFESTKAQQPKSLMVMWWHHHVTAELLGCQTLTYIFFYTESSLPEQGPVPPMLPSPPEHVLSCFLLCLLSTTLTAFGMDLHKTASQLCPRQGFWSSYLTYLCFPSLGGMGPAQPLEQACQSSQTPTTLALLWRGSESMTFCHFGRKSHALLQGLSWP